MNTYVPIFRGLDARGGRILRTDTHTNTRDNFGNPRRTLGAHAPEGYGSCPVCVSVRNLNLGTGAIVAAKFKTIPVLRRIRWYLSFVIPMCEAAGMSGHTYTHTYIHHRYNIYAYTQDNYSNNEKGTEVQTLGH